MTKWNKSKSVFPDQLIQLTDGVASTRNVIVRVVQLLITSNDVPVMSQPIEDNAGVITFKSMRNWNPTAAYALECARGLRKLYSELPQTMPAAKKLNNSE